MGAPRPNSTSCRKKIDIAKGARRIVRIFIRSAQIQGQRYNKSISSTSSFAHIFMRDNCSCSHYERGLLVCALLPKFNNYHRLTTHKAGWLRDYINYV